MFNPLEIIVELFDAIGKAMEKLPQTTPEQVAAFCKEADLSPVEVMSATNYVIRDLGEKSPYELIETFGGVIGYLESNGYIYDKDSNRFREE